MYSEIGSRELLGRNWTKPDADTRAPNVLAMLAHSHALSTWVTGVLLAERELSDRQSTLCTLVTVAQEVRVRVFV